MAKVIPKVLISCKECKKLLSSYLDKSLNALNQKIVELHLSRCEECFESFSKLIEEKIDKGEIPLRKAPYYPPQELYDRFLQAKEKRVGKFKVVLGHITNFPAIFPDISFYPEAIRLAAQEMKPRQKIANWQELEAEGIKAYLTLDINKNFKIGLESDRYEVKNALVAICIRKGKRLQQVKSARTNKEGIANLGEITSIPKPEEKWYILVVKR